MLTATHTLFKVIIRACFILLTANSSLLFAADPVSPAVQTIFDNNCLNCHQGNNPSGGLSLDDATTSGNALVDVVANCSNNGSKLVEPGDPDVSVLYIKLQANPNCGGIMPPGGPLLNASDLNTVYDWIVSIGPAAQFGLFSMNQTSVTVMETEPSVTLTVNRDLGTTGAVSVDYDVFMDVGDTAESPTDFVEVLNQRLDFADGETSKTITVTLADDTVFEGSEVFTVRLKSPLGGAVLGGASQTKISITDNEFDNKPGTFFFGKVSYTTDESGGDMAVIIIRSFGASGQVTVDLSSMDDTALAGSDYQTVSSTLVFIEGEKNQTVMIPIIDDSVEEAAESFTLSLSNPSGGAILGAPSSVTVNITDDDAPAAGGGGTGGGTGGTGGSTGGTGGTTTTPAEEAEYTAAGSLTILLPLLWLLPWMRRKIQF